MKRVVLGMSGGVDSSVAALLLQKQGYDVIGIFMKNWDDTDEETGICTAMKDFEDAKSVADQLGIKIYSVNFESEYWERVFENFLNEYKNGRTPNPDIMCNKEIKFKAFLDYVMDKFSPDYIATGHYARIDDRNGKKVMLRGLDNDKDQSYFLCQIKQEIFDKILFPVGELEKRDVRKIALDNNLATAEKKDSTGICFIGEKNFKEFLSEFIPNQHGNVVTFDGEIVGRHIGLMYYTIGQRKGLGLGGGPWYVAGRNLETRELYVVHEKDDEHLLSNKLIAYDMNYFNSCPNEFRATAKFRYRQKDVEVYVKKLENNCIEVSYENYSGVAPGQGVVLYDEDVCLGGAIIDEVFNKNVKKEYV